LAALLRKATAPDREKQALHHEQLAAAMDQWERDIAETRAATAEAQAG
jgi:hypothetical protein